MERIATRSPEARWAIPTNNALPEAGVVLQRLTISLTELAARFDELLDRANQGEEFTITNSGESVAVLGPVKNEPDPEEARHAIARLRDYAHGHPITNLTTGEIQSWIDEGRP